MQPCFIEKTTSPCFVTRGISSPLTVGKRVCGSFKLERRRRRMITKTKIMNKMAAPPSVPPTMALVGVCFECAMAPAGGLPNVVEKVFEVEVMLGLCWGFEFPFDGPPLITVPDVALVLEFVGIVMECRCGVPILKAFALDGLWSLDEVGGGTGGSGWLDRIVVDSVGGLGLVVIVALKENIRVYSIQKYELNRIYVVVTALVTVTRATGARDTKKPGLSPESSSLPIMSKEPCFTNNY